MSLPASGLPPFLKIVGIKRGFKMNEKLTYADLSDEDKLLMDGLFQHKAGKEVERKIYRNIIAQLRKREMDCTKDIMNLSQRAIGEKFDLGANSAKPLTKRNRENIENRKSLEKIKQRSGVQGLKLEQQQKVLRAIDEKKTCSENGQQSEFNCECPADGIRLIG